MGWDGMECNAICRAMQYNAMKEVKDGVYAEEECSVLNVINPIYTMLYHLVFFDQGLWVIDLCSFVWMRAFIRFWSDIT